MKAVGFYCSLPIEHEESLIDLEIEKPTPTGRDLLVQVKAVSVNPTDVKARVAHKQAEETFYQRITELTQQQHEEDVLRNKKHKGLRGLFQ